MKRFFFIWDRTNNRLLDETGQSLAADFFRFVRGDTFALCFTAKRYNVTTTLFEEETLPTTSTFQLIIKLGRFAASSGDADTQLAFVDTDGFDDTDDWSEAASGSAKHCARVALTETALATLLPVGASPISPILEITETALEGEASVQQQITIYPDMNRGGTTGVTTPTYYTAAQIDAMFAARIRVASGKRIVVEADGVPFSEDVP